jgi:hypothetical protein
MPLDFEAIQYHKQFISLVGQFNWALENFLLSRAMGWPSYINNTPSIANLFTFVCTLKGLEKSGNF